MAPRRRQPKVGLTRMHAALDAMRPMGFSADTVRKCLKNLLQVYGDEGWAFIEESAYKLLIDTMLEDPVVVQHECEPEPQNLLDEGGSQGPHEQQLVLQPPDKKAAPEDKARGLAVHEPKTHCKDVEIEQVGNRKRLALDMVKAEPVLLQDLSSPPGMALQLGFALAYTPETSGSNPKIRASRPCFGWISDDEDDEFLQLTPAAKGLGS